MNAITKKELKAYFLSPIGYVFMGVMLLLFGFFYTQVLASPVVGLYPRRLQLRVRLGHDDPAAAYHHAHVQ